MAGRVETEELWAKAEARCTYLQTQPGLVRSHTLISPVAGRMLREWIRGISYQALGEAPVPLEALPLLYEALFRLAEEKGLQVQSLDPGEAAPTGGVRAWRVRLLLEGPYAGVLGYLEGLPGLGKPLWVEAYTLEPVGERGERLALDLVLRVLAP